MWKLILDIVEKIVDKTWMDKNILGINTTNSQIEPESFVYEHNCTQQLSIKHTIIYIIYSIVIVVVIQSPFSPSIFKFLNAMYVINVLDIP